MSLADEWDALPTKSAPATKPLSAADEWASIPSSSTPVHRYTSADIPDDSGRIIPQPQSSPEPSLMDKIRAGVEATGGTLSSVATSLVAMPYGVAKDIYERTFGEGKPGVSQADKYASEVMQYAPGQPKTALAQEYQGKIGEALSSLPPVLPEIPPVSASTQMAAQFARAKLGTEGAEAVKSIPAKMNFGANSVGAGQAPMTAVAKAHNASPELVSEIAKHESQGTLNPVIAQRHLDADSLPTVTDEYGNPIKIQLSKGEVTQDPDILSQEKNARSANPDLTARYNNNGKALPLVLDKFREQAAPDIYFKNTPEEGQFYIDKLSAIHDQLKNEISQNYKDYFDAKGGAVPMNGKDFVNSAKQALESQDRADFVPPEVQKLLDKYGQDDSDFTYGKFENLRTILGEQQRKFARSGDGTSEGAVNIIRNQLENIPIPEDNMAVKELADKARQSARFEKQLQETTPAYKAVAQGSARPDDFTSKYITGNTKTAGKNELQNFLNLFPDDNEMHQALAYSTLNDIKNQSINPKGALSSDKLGKSIAQGYSTGKHEMLLPMPILDGLNKLNSTAQLIQGAPAGHYIQGNPNVAASIGEAIRSGLAKGTELTGNTIGLGYVPIGTGIVQAFKNKAASKAAGESLKAGAGLDYQPKSQ